MRGSRIAFLVALAVLAAAGGAARAQSRYERLKVTALKKAGKVIGARVKLVLRPDTGWNPGADRVRIGLGSMDKAKAGNDHRARRPCGPAGRAGYPHPCPHAGR